MVPQNTKNDQLTTLSEWEKKTSWATVFSGPGVHEWFELRRGDDRLEDPTEIERWESATMTEEIIDEFTDAGIEGFDHAKDMPVTTLIAYENHVELDPESSDSPLWWPDDVGTKVDKLTAYAGVRGISRADAARKLRLDEASVVKSLEWIFESPGLDKITTAAATRRVNPWGVLGVVLARAAVDIPPEVTSWTKGWGKGSFNLFIALCGPSGRGKSKTTQLGKEMVRRGGTNFARRKIDKPFQFNVGSAEGLINPLQPRTAEGEVIEDEDDLMNPAVERVRAIYSVPELSRLYGDRYSPNSSQEPTLLSLWANEDTSAERKARENSIKVPDWSYRVCFLVSAQPKWVHRLASETDSGFAQRWIYLPTGKTRRKFPNMNEDRTSAEVQDIPTVDVPHEVWDVSNWDVPKGEVTVDVVASNYVQFRMELQDFLDDEAVDNGAPEDPFKAHRTYNQARVAAALSVITTGTVEVSPEMWHLAGAVMDVSDLTRVQMVRSYEGKHRRDKIKDAAEKIAIKDSGMLEDVEDKLVELLGEHGSMSAGVLRNRLSRPKREFYFEAEANLVRKGMIKVEDIIDSKTKKVKGSWVSLVKSK